MVEQQFFGQIPALDMNPFFFPDGKMIAFQSDRDGRKEVWVMNADGSGQRRLSDEGCSDHFMRWSPDGNWVCFDRVTPEGGDIWIMEDFE